MIKKHEVRLVKGHLACCDAGRRRHLGERPRQRPEEPGRGMRTRPALRRQRGDRATHRANEQLPTPPPLRRLAVLAHHRSMHLTRQHLDALAEIFDQFRQLRVLPHKLHQVIVL